MADDNSGQSPRGRHRSRSFPANGDLLRSLRVARGWTQEDAAAKAGVSDRLIRKSESGGALEIHSLAILASLYGTPDCRLTPGDLLAEPLTTQTRKSATGATHEAEALVRRWFDELWNQGRLEVIDELAAPNCVLYAEGREHRGRAAVRQRAAAVHAAFSDIDVEIQELTVLNDIVICRWSAAITHTGAFLGIPPSGKRLVVRASTWIRFIDGLFTDGWDYWDQPLDDAVLAR